MRIQSESQDTGDRVRELYGQGLTRHQIREALDVTEWTVTAALRGEPLREPANRPRAKDDLRAKARELRLQGLFYEEIAAQLHVSKSTLSLWLRDLPKPVSQEEARRRGTAAARKRWEELQPVRDAERAAEHKAAAAEVGPLTDREIFVAGVIAYWCEGSKNKPYRRNDRVVFMNSDAGLIRFFLRFLDSVGVSRDDLVFSVSIHERADVEAAHRFWLRVTNAPREQFAKPVIKRHNPKTNRKNVGETYHGCLMVRVRRSSKLYRKIEGWASAVTSIDSKRVIKKSS